MKIVASANRCPSCGALRSVSDCVRADGLQLYHCSICLPERQVEDYRSLVRDGTLPDAKEKAKGISKKLLDGFVANGGKVALEGEAGPVHITEPMRKLLGWLVILGEIEEGLTEFREDDDGEEGYP